MRRISFKMKLYEGLAGEYKKRHDEIWPELKNKLKEAGISDFGIFFDEETNILFAVQKIADPEKAEKLPDDPIMKKWWDYMADIMETNPDNSPKEVELKEMFYMK